MSGEYISREAAISKIRDEGVLGGDYDAYEREEDVVDMLNSIPAADVVEVRHGRWSEQPLDFDLCGVAYYQCSECGKEQQTPSNYCQFCGAKMDGGQDDV